MDWKELTINDKAELISLFVKNGITDINQMRRLYADGGDKTTLNNPRYNRDAEDRIYAYLRDEGLSHSQASAFMGNIAVESLLNADINQEKGGPAKGLLQTEPDRYRKLQQYNEVPYKFGIGLTPDEQHQLDYFINKGVKNYTSGEWGRKSYKKEDYKSARDARKDFNDPNRTAQELSDILMKSYFRPSKPQEWRRDKMTDYFYNEMPTRFPYFLNEYGKHYYDKDLNIFDTGGNVYTVERGDTLSAISKKFLGKASDYMQIAAANNLNNPDKIVVGQKLIIPEKFDVPLKKKDIPTSNKTIVIDNYSPNYNYIVENDKIYYSRKGHDYWVDISDNDKARKNLYTFLKDKYNFRGYEDEESKIANRINNNDFNYKHYRDSVNRTILDYNNHLEEQNKDYFQLLNQTFTPTYQTNKKKQTKESPKSSNIGTQNKNLENNTDWSKILNDNYNSFIANTSLNTKKEESNVNTSNNNQEEKGIDLLKYYFTLGKNYIERQIDKRRDKDEKSNFNIPVFTDENSEYGIIPASYTGDTLRVNNDKRRYIVPESIDVSEYVFGARNRGEMEEINSEAAPITSFKPFKPYGQHKQGYKTYIGIDKNGRVKVGDINQFEEGDMLSGTYSNIVYSFAHDDNGNFIWQDDSKHGNASKNVPAVMVKDEKTGNLTQRFPINILANKKDAKGTTYGNITGGRVLVKVGDELRLLSGSIKDIENEFESMKKRQKADYGIFYTLDNGSYNRGLRTYDKKFTTEDLTKYDRQNTGDSGNFLYIKDRYQQFPTDTTYTPNIRTKNDESYKKGHSDINERKGVVLHHTAFMDNDLSGVTNHFMNPRSEASAHVVIGYDGNRRVFANPDQVTFHAGSSYFNGRDNVNDFMIGIEFQGDTNKKPLTEEQIDSAVEYLAPIIRANNISLENITTHEVVRDLYNKYRTQLNLGRRAPSKSDISFTDYQRVIEKLKKIVYYKK